MEQIKLTHLKGDLHFHMAPDGAEVGNLSGSWDSHINGEEMIDWLSKYLPELKYLVITDHLERFGRDPKRFNEGDKYGVEYTYDELKLVATQLARIRNLGDRTQGLQVIAGLETSIQRSGSIGASKRMLDMFDLVLASEHYYPASKSVQSPEQLTNRFVSAIKNPGVDIIGHPARNYADWQLLDWEKIAQQALDFDKAVEINMTGISQLGFKPEIRIEPVRSLEILQILAKTGVKVSLGSDMHKFWPLGAKPSALEPHGRESSSLQPGQIFGLNRLMRDLNHSGFQKSQILNTYSADELIAWAKGHG